MRKHSVKRVRKTVEAVPAGQLPWRFFILTILCACILAAGFFYAARQHFSTMDFGLKNSKLRKQIEDLESERRRLILAKEVSLSPMEITRAAQTMGFREKSEAPQPATIAEIKTETGTVDPQLVLASVRQPKKPVNPEERSDESKRLVKPIIQQAPVKSSAVNERPRIVADTDKRIASTSAKATPKLQ